MDSILPRGRVKSPGRLIVVSNRLPITFEDGEGPRRCHPSDGGLVRALLPIVRESRGCWIGWTGTDRDDDAAEAVKDWASTQTCSFEPVFLTRKEKEWFYNGCSNEIIWPLFHGFPSRCNFDSAYWAAYCQANEKYADVVQRATADGDSVWVHDYHLMVLAPLLRERGIHNRLSYFHHIPFPAPYVFEMLPRRAELLRGLMHYDAVGFQTERDRVNFIACLQHCLPDVSVSGRGQKMQVKSQGRQTTVTVNPISIDFAEFNSEAASEDVTRGVESIQRSVGDAAIVLGVDRLDYTKGIPERLIAFQTLLERHPEMKGRVTLMQIVVPSRESIPEYAQLKLRIETLVSTINGEHGGPGWTPVQYFHRRISQPELITFYGAAKVALVTPLRDGMNLVAKEFCASRIDEKGVLILSEFAGAAAELKCGALLVNPNDVEEVGEALYQALHMSDEDEQSRMHAMRAHLRNNDVYDWAESCGSREFQPVREALARILTRSWKAAARAPVNPAISASQEAADVGVTPVRRAMP